MLHLPVHISPGLLVNISPHPGSRLVGLPAETQYQIFSHLDFIDQSILAVTCKHLAQTYVNLNKDEAPRRRRPPTHLMILRYLLSFHENSTRSVIPHYRLCFCCAMFRRKKGKWGGNTKYLTQRKVTKKQAELGPRCPRCVEKSQKDVQDRARRCAQLLNEHRGRV